MNTLPETQKAHQREVVLQKNSLGWWAPPEGAQIPIRFSLRHPEWIGMFVCINRESSQCGVAYESGNGPEEYWAQTSKILSLNPGLELVFDEGKVMNIINYLKRCIQNATERRQGKM
ncbi:hypothetical protein A3G69_00790 [Candidatus Peribacteria bacterium RIFCSPLOWO2_12_FULL_53_10]|nr:MAG: hypothetical protein A3B61_05340 [Candidatus Peribacteria bacterium RIFCSPLOWO2_01_FULL_53_10]OGJ70771.1 MAG: hypothetical protein A3G69_00790 [Candidatus Peribacteria bacterium RIFCSPLOWO2_12_FULL_53_10]